MDEPYFRVDMLGHSPKPSVEMVRVILEHPRVDLNREIVNGSRIATYFQNLVEWFVHDVTILGILFRRNDLKKETLSKTLTIHNMTFDVLSIIIMYNFKMLDMHFFIANPNLNRIPLVCPERFKKLIKLRTALLLLN